MRRRASHEQQRILAARLLTLSIVVTSPVLSASDNPDLRCLIDSASRSLRSRQFDRAINDLIPAQRVAKRERASSETLSAILSNLGYSYRMVGRCGDAVTVLTEEMRAWDRGMVENYRDSICSALSKIYAYNCGWFGTPEEIDRSFEQAKALGAHCITLSGTVSL